MNDTLTGFVPSRPMNDGDSAVLQRIAWTVFNLRKTVAGLDVAHAAAMDAATNEEMEPGPRHRMLAKLKEQDTRLNEVLKPALREREVYLLHALAIAHGLYEHAWKGGPSVVIDRELLEKKSARTGNENLAGPNILKISP